MGLLEKYLVVKKSTLPDAGKGLFTTKFIPKGARIVEYKGRISDWKSAEHEKGSNKYLFYVRRDHVINAEPFKKALARYANDARGMKRKKGVTNNALYTQEGLKIFIEAKRDIPAGSEILVDYGKEYWDVIRHNQKIEAEEKE